MRLILLAEGILKGCLDNLEAVKINPGFVPGYYYFLYLYILNDKRIINSLSKYYFQEE
jgi:hypothetical protein